MFGGNLFLFIIYSSSGFYELVVRSTDPVITCISIISWIPIQVVPKIVKNMTYVLWVNLSLAILISIFGFYKTFKKWFEDKQKDDPEFPRNSGLTDTNFFMIDLLRNR